MATLWAWVINESERSADLYETLDARCLNNALDGAGRSRGIASLFVPFES